MNRNKQDEKAQEKTSEKSRKEKLAALLTVVEGHLSDKNTKVSISDFMRLVQFERQLADEERPREIKVTWSETLETYDTDE